MNKVDLKEDLIPFFKLKHKARLEEGIAELGSLVIEEWSASFEKTELNFIQTREDVGGMQAILTYVFDKNRMVIGLLKSIDQLREINNPDVVRLLNKYLPNIDYGRLAHSSVESDAVNKFMIDADMKVRIIYTNEKARDMNWVEKMLSYLKLD